MPNNTNLIFMVSDPKTGEMPARKLKSNMSSVVAGKIGSSGCGIAGHSSRRSNAFRGPRPGHTGPLLSCYAL